MKKKFSLWVNLAVICLCVCSIAIGVYAATSATLTVSGQIGFQAHECSVEVSGEIYGHAKDATLTTVYTSTDPAEITMDTDATGIVGGTNATVTNPVSLGTLNFTDLVGDTIPSIVVSLTVTNQSPYKVAATVTVNDPHSNVGYVRYYTHNETTDGLHESAVILDAASDSITTDTAKIKVVLSVMNPNKDVSLSDLNISANFAKYMGDATPAQVIDEDTLLIYSLRNDDASWAITGIDFNVDDNGEVIFDDELGAPMGTLTSYNIPSFVMGLPVTHIDEYVFCALDVVTEIILPDTLISIGNNAFEDVGPITQIVIPGSVTTIKNSAFNSQNENMFSNNITIGNGVKSIEAGVFSGVLVSSLTIPASVTDCDNFILYASRLETITFEGKIPPEFKNETDAALFEECSLTAIYVPAGSEQAYIDALVELDENSLLWELIQGV